MLRLPEYKDEPSLRKNVMIAILHGSQGFSFSWSLLSWVSNSPNHIQCLWQIYVFTIDNVCMIWHVSLMKAFNCDTWKKKNDVCVIFTEFFFHSDVWIVWGRVQYPGNVTVPHKETPQEYYLFLTEHGLPLHIHLKEDSCFVVDITWILWVGVILNSWYISTLSLSRGFKDANLQDNFC